MTLRLSDIKTGYVLLLGALVYLSVLLSNDGFMALDEYWVGITRYIPAQSSTVMTLVSEDDVKSPLQLLPMYAVAQTALAVGVESPYLQYRSVIFVLGFVSVVLLFLAALAFARTEKLQRLELNYLLLLFIFYFAGPFSYTRPMFESIAAPWLALSAVWGFRYDQHGHLKDLLWAVFFVSVAFVLRQQLGFCALALVCLPVLRKKWKHVIAAGALGLLFFILSGIPDYYIRGAFHHSLLSLTVYNYQHGAEYGNQSVLFYPAWIFAVSFMPFLIKKYPHGFVRNQLRKYRVIWLMLVLFVFLHSLFPQKWERFIISVLPLLVLALFPFFLYLQQNFRQHRWRLISLYSLNGFLFLVASYFPAQKNLIEMSLYLDQHPEVRYVYRVADTPGWITEAFIRNKQFEYVESDHLDLSSVDWSDCSRMLVVGQAQAQQYAGLTDSLNLRAQFDVNLIEQLAFKLNPEKNLRRVRLKLYSGCKG